MRVRGRRLLIVPALAALVLGTAVAAQAHAGPVTGTRAAIQLVEEDPVGLTGCSGGAQLGNKVLMKDQETLLPPAGVFTPLTDATITFNVTDATDQIRVLFTAEAGIEPDAVHQPDDGIELRITLNGVPMQPGTLVFNTNTTQANATQACARVGQGAHTLQVEWRVVNSSGAVVSGSLAHWAFTVIRSN